MFRRKEENSDPSNPSEVSSQSSSVYAESVAPSAPIVQPVSAPVSQSTANSTYVPTTPVSRPAQEAVRAPAPVATVPASAASTYRPAPIAEFNRGAPRSTSEALRASAPAAPVASFASPVVEKNPATASSKPVRRVLTVGNDILLKGEIATCDRLVIEGRVEAKLSDVHTVEIAEVGSFKGTAEVENAEVSGVFEGDLIVHNRLVIYSSGEVRGNITYGEIEIERGGKMTGQIKTVGAAQSTTKGKSVFDADKSHVHAKETAAA